MGGATHMHFRGTRLQCIYYLVLYIDLGFHLQCIYYLVLYIDLGSQGYFGV